MGKKLSENLIRLRCATCKRINYYTRKNKKLVEKKLEYSKFCPWCRSHEKHKEIKLK